LRPSLCAAALLVLPGIGGLWQPCPLSAQAAGAVRTAESALLRSAQEAVERARGPEVTALCLSLGPATQAADPPDSLVAALESAPARVVRYSDCERGADGRLVERHSGGRALLVFTSVPTVADSAHATAELGFIGGPAFGTGWTCALVHGPTGWRVDTCDLQWAS